MAKTKSKKVSKKKPESPEKIRKTLLESYRKLKIELGGDPRKEIARLDFERKTEITRHYIEKYFRTYTEFRNQAENYFRSKLKGPQKALMSERAKKFDSTVSQEECLNDLRRVQEEHWGKHITRNFYREHGKYSDSTWHQFFGTFQEFRRQAGLELSRHQAAIEKSVARQASVDHYRDFFDTEILPYFNKYEKDSGNPSHVKTILAMSDLHDKECCEFSLSVFLDTCKRKQPDVIVLNGDIYDLLEFGRYSVDPRHYDIKRRFDFVRERVYAPLRAACPNAQIDLIAGNHEMRLLKLLADATPNVRILLSDVMDIGFQEIFGLDEFEINWSSKFDLGAYTKSDMNNEIKKNYRVYYDCFVFSHHPEQRLKSMSGSNGHHHQGQINPHSFVDPISSSVKKLTWSQTPGMHEADAEYLNGVPGWNKGFLEVTINLKTQESIQKIHYTHDEWTVIDGVYYENSEE